MYIEGGESERERETQRGGREREGEGERERGGEREERREVNQNSMRSYNYCPLILYNAGSKKRSATTVS